MQFLVEKEKIVRILLEIRCAKPQREILVYFLNWQNFIKDDLARPESSEGSEGGAKLGLPPPLVAPLLEEECGGKGVGKEEIMWNVGGGRVEKDLLELPRVSFSTRY